MNDDTSGPDQESIDRLKKSQALSGASPTNLLKSLQQFATQRERGVQAPLLHPAEQKSSSTPQAQQRAQSSQKDKRTTKGASFEYFSGPGSTATRRQFWNKAIEIVALLQKRAGKNVSVDEYEGQGSIINVPDRGRGTLPLCNLSPGKLCRNKTVIQNKIGFRNIHGDCAGSFGTGLRYTDVSYSCDDCSRTLGTGDADIRFYLQADGGLTECTAAHLVLGGGCFGHHTGGGDCGCGGTGTISFTLITDPGAGTTIDPSIGNGLADVTSCSGSITHGATTYTCSDFDVNSLFDSALSDCGCSITLTTEYTTEQLIEDAIANMPPDYEGDFLLGECNAERNLAEDEHEILLQRAQYKFFFDAAPADCVLRWRERTTDLDDNCLFDTFKSVIVHAGDTETELFEMFEPEANGFVKVVGECCVLPDCFIYTRSECNTAGGTWLDSTCPTPCDGSDCA